MHNLDKQMQQWSARLRDDLRIAPPESNELATTITKEVASLSDDAKQRVKGASQIPLNIRIEELTMMRFEVSRQALSFWQALARCTAYASFLTL